MCLADCLAPLDGTAPAASSPYARRSGHFKAIHCEAGSVLSRGSRRREAVDGEAKGHAPRQSDSPTAALPARLLDGGLLWPPARLGSTHRGAALRKLHAGNRAYATLAHDVTGDSTAGDSVTLPGSPQVWSNRRR